jgi:hypothetical protein
MTVDSGDPHAALTTLTDRLLERVASLTRTMQAGTAPLGDADRAAARLMLDDLQLVASSWRTAHEETARRLDAAATELADAAAILRRALGDRNA